MRIRLTLAAAFLLTALAAACAPAPAPTAVPPTPSPAATRAPVFQPLPTRAPEFLCPTQNDEAAAAYKAGQEAAKAGDLAAAEKQFQRAAELDPAYCDAMDNLAALLRSQDRLEEAVAWLNKSLEAKPDNLASLATLGRLYIMLGKPDEAVDPYVEYSKYAPDDPLGYYGVGMAYYITNDFELAAISLARAEKLLTEGSPYALDVRYLLGMSLFYAQQLDSARTYLLMVYPDMSEDIEANIALGLCYLYGSEPNLELARQYVEKAESLGAEVPDDVRADLKG